jgi:hypothetical protein
MRIGREAVEHVVGNQSRTDQESISRFWDVLDDPHLKVAVGQYRGPRHLADCNLEYLSGCASGI